MPDVLEGLLRMIDALGAAIDRELPAITDDTLHNLLNDVSNASARAAVRIEQIHEARPRP